MVMVLSLLTYTSDAEPRKFLMAVFTIQKCLDLDRLFSINRLGVQQPGEG